MGYSVAAFMSDPIHMKLGQRGMAMLGPLFRLVAYAVLAIHPPYAVVVIIFVFAGFGNGIIDACVSYVAELKLRADFSLRLDITHGWETLQIQMSFLVSYMGFMG